jgi:hypothetical protein
LAEKEFQFEPVTKSKNGLWQTEAELTKTIKSKILEVQFSVSAKIYTLTLPGKQAPIGLIYLAILLLPESNGLSAPKYADVIYVNPAQENQWAIPKAVLNLLDRLIIKVAKLGTINSADDYTSIVETIKQEVRAAKIHLGLPFYENLKTNAWNTVHF